MKEDAQSGEKSGTFTFEQLVRKILQDPDFARELHHEIAEARRNKLPICEKVAAHFKITPEELKELGVSEKDRELFGRTTPTTFMMLDFAAYAHPSHRD